MNRDIMSKISEGRGVIRISKAYDNSVALGLAPMKRQESNSKPLDYDHYHINSGECLSEDEAIIKFWEDYESKGPYKDGKIFWRLEPEVQTYKDFTSPLTKYNLEARFAIGGESNAKT